MKRRDVLRTAASLGIGSLVLANTASADPTTSPDPEHISKRNKYENTDEVRKEVRNHAIDLLKKLSDKEIIDSSSPSDLSAFSGPDSIDKNDQIKVMSTFDEQTQTPTAILRIAEEVEETLVAIFVLPEAERNYATIDDGEDRSQYLTTTTPDKSAHNSHPRTGGNMGAIDISDIEKEIDMSDLMDSDSERDEFTTFSGEGDIIAEGSTCTSRECWSGTNACYDRIGGGLPCEEIHYEREDWRMYENYVCEVWNTVCTNECCEDSGGWGRKCSTHGC